MTTVMIRQRVQLAHWASLRQAEWFSALRVQLGQAIMTLIHRLPAWTVLLVLPHRRHTLDFVTLASQVSTRLQLLRCVPTATLVHATTIMSRRQPVFSVRLGFMLREDMLDGAMHVQLGNFLPLLAV